MLSLSEIRAGRSVGVDDAFGEKVIHFFAVIVRHVSGVDVVEAAVFSHDDDDMLNGTGGFTSAGIAGTSRRKPGNQSPPEITTNST